jgi:hypothetical protein
MKNKNKILFVDLETSPTLGYSWTLWEANILKVVEPWRILCFSYKWLGDKKTHIVSLPQFKEYKRIPRMIENSLSVYGSYLTKLIS